MPFGPHFTGEARADLPLVFHPVATGVRRSFTPIGMG